MSGENRQVDVGRIDEILRILRRVSDGDFAERLQVPDGDGPLAQLALGINATIDALAESRRQQQAAQEALGQREAFLRRGERIGELGSWDWQIVRNALVWSDEVYRMFGLDPATCTPSVDSFLDLLHPDDREPTAAAIDHSVNSGEPYHTRFRVVRPDGQIVYIEARAEIERDDVGRAKRMTGTVLNITDRVRIEEDLRESEQRFRDMWNAVPDVVWLHDRGTVIAANQAAAEFAGRSDPAELAGVDLLSMIPPEDRDRIRRHFESGAENPVEVHTTTASGREVDFEAHARNVRYRGREVRVVAARDVTARKEAMRQLEESEQRFRRMWNAVPDPVFIHDGGVIVEANQALADLVGLPLEQIPGRSAFDFIRPDSHETVRRSMEEDSESPHEIVGLAPDGRERLLEFRGRSVPYRGRTMRVVAVRDITEREQALRELGESEHRFRQLWDAVPEGVFIHDQGRIIEANRTLSDMTGYPQDQLISMNAIESLVAEDYRGTVVQNVRAGLEQPYEIIAVRADGSRFPVEIRGKRVQYRGRTMRVAAVRDLSEGRQAEQALRESEARNRALVNAIPDALLRVRRNGRIVSFKPGRDATPGLPEDGGVGRHLRDLFPPETAMTLELLLNKPSDHPVPSLEFTLDADPPAHYEARVVAIDDQEAMAILRNVTAYRRAERESAELAAQLRQSQKMEAIGTLAGGIAHDFNNLLVAISGNAELLELEMTDGPGEAAGLCLEEIRDACERAGQLIRRLMFFSRRQVVQPRVVDINTVVDDMQRMLGRLIGENIHLQTRLASRPLSVKVDPGHIEQVLVNLAVNARDAMPDGGELRIETGVTNIDWADSGSAVSLAPGPYVELRVIDSGVGMDRATVERIFEPFFTTKSRGKGTGLGLSTVYGIVQQANGDVRVHSQPGHGTTFTVWLPLSDDPPESPTDTAELRRAARGANALILLVEDDEAVRDVVERTLVHAGYRVVVANSGDEALERLEGLDRPLDVLLTDVVMPGITGRELARRVEERFPDVRTLFMSGYAEVPGEQEVPPGQLLQKPFAAHDLEERIHELLSRRRDD